MSGVGLRCKGWGLGVKVSGSRLGFAIWTMLEDEDMDEDTDAETTKDTDKDKG